MCIGKIDKVTFGGAKKLNFSSTVEAEDVNKKIIIILKISPLSLFSHALLTHLITHSLLSFLLFVSITPLSVLVSFSFIFFRLAWWSVVG